MDIHERLQWARQAAGFDEATEAAEALGLPAPTYLAHENGSRGFKRKADVYARKFKVSVDWLMTGRGNPKSNRQAQAAGYIGAGAQVLPIDDHEPGAGLEPIDVPPGVPLDAVLVIVRGNSMYPRYYDGELLFYVKRDEDPARFVGQECVVKLHDGRTFVKILRRGTAPGFFNLESWNAPLIEDQSVEWAAPVNARVNRQRVA